jgi:hypothetical protein
MSSPWNRGLGLLTSQLGCVSGSHFYTLSHGTIPPPCSLNQKDMVSPQQAITSGLWEVIRLPFCLLRQAWIWTGFLIERREVLLSCFLGLSGLLCASTAFTPYPKGCTLVTKEVITHHLPVIPVSPQVMLWEIMSWDRSLWRRLAGSNIYCAGPDPLDSCPKAEHWEQRGLTLYTLASRLQKEKAKLNPHMAACVFIGYFISPVLCDLHVSIL